MGDKYKVFGGLVFAKCSTRGIKQVRAVIASTSRKKAHEILEQSYKNMTFNHFKNYWSETGNKREVELACKTPETLVIIHE